MLANSGDSGPPCGVPSRVPVTNPFQAAGQVKEIYAYGFRNPYRYSFDRLNGQLIVADVGQNTVEEIDATLSGSEMTVGFNPEYLAAGVEAVVGDEITIETSDPIKPAVLRGVGAEDYLYLVMPQRLNN